LSRASRLFHRDGLIFVAAELNEYTPIWPAQPLMLFRAHFFFFLLLFFKVYSLEIFAFGGSLRVPVHMVVYWKHALSPWFLVVLILTPKKTASPFTLETGPGLL